MPIESPRTARDRDEALQRAFYRETAAKYDAFHDLAQIEFSLFVLDGFLRRRNIKSPLDVGSGRALRVCFEIHEQGVQEEF